MTTANLFKVNEAEIRQLVADQQRAICSKDVAQIMSRYATEAILFDIKPPFQTKGKAAIHQLWEDCLPYLPESFGMETQDLTVTVNDNLAIAHWLFRWQGEQNHPAMQMWMRATAVCQKKEGNWQILHEHISVPLDPSHC